MLYNVYVLHLHRSWTCGACVGYVIDGRLVSIRHPTTDYLPEYSSHFYLSIDIL